ncbi:cobyrinate a,c-diamide synthase [Thermosynechococcus sp. HN-54]|uniref:cobyrinate a,c-diamide synthase n=1 Tax=Thermosynechococcus sp. HN-54 TaxID=2933959 RepID=UPI00202CF21D|nr:cobyrinate a,c-diamide synthase [Thermosynechococcus sp. HN-54]URR36349.1 cobyrinate a,c-diamide synthase [Thermosynechococcus sp. HN-54]
MVLVIAGDRSGVGKTTVALALNAALKARGQRLQTFKVGPDYIDPLFHSTISGRPCRNLDVVLTSAEYVRACVGYYSQGMDAVLIEGVMGLFDGRGGTPEGSTAHVAHLLKAPILLVLDVQKQAASVAALVYGFCHYDPSLQIAGVVLNRVASDRHRQILEAALAPLGVPILGVIYRDQALALPSRHLGLVPPHECREFQALGDRLAHLGNTCFDWERLTPLLAPAPTPSASPVSVSPVTQVAIGIAQDSAFHFYYADTLDLLQALGATLIPVSPLRDTHLPTGLNGLILGGGFPEVFAPELAANHSFLESLRQAIQGGLAIYAECGGLMYLSQGIQTSEGHYYPLVGHLSAVAHMGKKLTLGYRQATALQTTVCLQAGEVVQGHEFHYSHLSAPPPTPLWQLNGAPEGWGNPRLHASYLHLHWGGHPQWAVRFLQQAAQVG